MQIWKKEIKIIQKLKNNLEAYRNKTKLFFKINEWWFALTLRTLSTFQYCFKSLLQLISLVLSLSVIFLPLFYGEK